MAMQDYFYDCQKLETETVSDGFGGYETVEYLGVTFKGLCVIKGSSEQLIGALRGNENTQYTFHCGINVPLDKDNKVTYIEKGNREYLRLTSSAVINTDKSQQTDWKSYNAESYTPTTIIQKINR